MQYVYILTCSDGKHYVGCTGDLKKRIQRHQEGREPYTKNKLPVELIFYCGFKDEGKGFAFEKYLKSGSGRAFVLNRLV